MDRFSNTIEINLDFAANAQMKSIEAIEQGHRDIGFLHFFFKVNSIFLEQ
jgi:hypothetical protein